MTLMFGHPAPGGGLSGRCWVPALETGWIEPGLAKGMSALGRTALPRLQVPCMFCSRISGYATGGPSSSLGLVFFGGGQLSRT